ncbi:unnamed protein product [Urochloa humidicola]
MEVVHLMLGEFVDDYTVRVCIGVNGGPGIFLTSRTAARSSPLRQDPPLPPPRAEGVCPARWFCESVSDPQCLVGRGPARSGRRSGKIASSFLIELSRPLTARGVSSCSPRRLRPGRASAMVYLPMAATARLHAP